MYQMKEDMVKFACYISKTGILVIAILVFLSFRLNAQDRFSIGPELTLRSTKLNVSDPGGYLVADQYNQRLTYGLLLSYQIADRVRLISGVRRISFAKDENYWFKTQEIILFVKQNPITGFQLPIGVNYYLFKTPRRFGICLGPALLYNRIERVSSTGGRRLVSSASNAVIQSVSRFSVQDINFWAFAPSITFSYRLGLRGQLYYSFEKQFSFAKDILVMDIDYVVETTNSTNDYQARTNANGTASHHSIGFRFNL